MKDNNNFVIKDKPDPAVLSTCVPDNTLRFHSEDKVVASVNLKTGEVITDLPLDEAGKQSAKIFFDSFADELLSLVKDK